jgi:glycerol-1-phosphate dehydrogenase [NAD(P)+]
MNEEQQATNLVSQRFGEGAVDGAARDWGDFVVTSMPVPWRIVQGRLGKTPRAVLMADSMELEVVERQTAAAPPCDLVVAIGGGRAIDLGKYLAWKRGLQLVTIPTVLSVDAFVTPAAGIRVKGKVEYLGRTSPDPLIIDYTLLRSAPNELNIAGIGDLISIHTATRDWELAEQAGRSEYPFCAESVERARMILKGVGDLAAEIRDCTNAGLQALVDGYLEVNRICLPAGHYRVEEGSEHYLFYALEERLERTFIHGPIIGLGVKLMALLQENDPDGIAQLMKEVGLICEPAAMDLSREALESALLNLRSYVEGRPDLWYTVINERPIGSALIEKAVDELEFA